MSDSIFFVDPSVVASKRLSSKFDYVLSPHPMCLLSDLRRSRGLSQSELASVIGVSRNTISSYERGLFKPRGDVLIKLVSFFDCKFSDIYLSII